MPRTAASSKTPPTPAKGHKASSDNIQRTGNAQEDRTGQGAWVDPATPEGRTKVGDKDNVAKDAHVDDPALDVPDETLTSYRKGIEKPDFSDDQVMQHVDMYALRMRQGLKEASHFYKIAKAEAERRGRHVGDDRGKLPEFEIGGKVKGL